MRANYGQKYYDQYATKKVKPEVKPATRGTLRVGSTGEMVKALQSALNGMGYNCGKVDGIFGKGTETALKEFQYDNDLVRDGVCGTITWAALDKANYYKAKVTANVLNVRSGPGTNHSIKTTVKKDTVVTVVSTKNNFARLIKNGGYVSLDYIKKI
jgi:peptidoglycan hydrolase-like protein with peptidoglycan-binding domain